MIVLCDEDFLRQQLLNKLEKKQKNNPAFSIRAMARDVGISQSQLTRILSGDTRIGTKATYLIGKYLELTEGQIYQALVCSLNLKS